MTTETYKKSVVVDMEKTIPATRDTEVNQNVATATFFQNDLLDCSRYVGHTV